VTLGIVAFDMTLSITILNMTKLSVEALRLTIKCDSVFICSIRIN
jgi:hypothetical protein